MKILGTICARGGSKGVKGKNLKMLNGKPLIAYTIELAIKWGKFDKIIVSTDDENIIKIAKDYGIDVPFVRPKELSTDNAGKIGAIKHAVKFLENQNEFYDVVIDMDATAPLRTLEDIDSCLKLFLDNDVNNVYSVCECHKNPYFNMVELGANNYVHISKKLSSDILSRQMAPKVYEMNASIYVYNKDFLLATNSVHSDKTMVYVMPQERSVDIDNQIDFNFVEYLLKEGVVKIG